MWQQFWPHPTVTGHPLLSNASGCNTKRHSLLPNALGCNTKIHNVGQDSQKLSACCPTGNNSPKPGKDEMIVWVPKNDAQRNHNSNLVSSDCRGHNVGVWTQRMHETRTLTQMYTAQVTQYNLKCLQTACNAPTFVHPHVLLWHSAMHGSYGTSGGIEPGAHTVTFRTSKCMQMKGRHGLWCAACSDCFRPPASWSVPTCVCQLTPPKAGPGLRFTTHIHTVGGNLASKILFASHGANTDGPAETTVTC
jgi:hypothetical protein